MSIHVGMSGWTFAPWRGKFYPKGLAQKRELEYASRQLNSIEVNGTFYGLQKPPSFMQWRDATPPGFVFSIKGGQYITHVRRLKDVREPLATFLGSGLLCLGRKLGPILWQFPPNVMLKDDRFERFFEMLPHDSRSAARFADAHGRKEEGKNFTDVTEDFPVRHAFEFRHPSFKNPEFIALMRKHRVAVVFAHTGEPFFEEPTADFIYARMHGEGKGYGKGYPDSVIVEWAGRVREWSKTLDVFTYFDTEKKVHAPANALSLARELGLQWEHPVEVPVRKR